MLSGELFKKDLFIYFLKLFLVRKIIISIPFKKNNLFFCIILAFLVINIVFSTKNDFSLVLNMIRIENN